MDGVESKNCLECHKTFTQLPEDIDGRSFRVKKYCSPKCRNNHLHRGDSRVKKICEVCGKEYLTSFISQKFCSYECSLEGRKRRKQAFRERDFTVPT